MSYKINELVCGMEAELIIVIQIDDIEKFAECTGDTSPIHLDEEYAKKTRFKGRIAHGMLLGGYISRLLGTMMPGEGTIYLEQTLKFLKPVYPEDKITIKGKVIEIVEEKNVCSIETTCINQYGKMIAKGMAKVMPPKE